MSDKPKLTKLTRREEEVMAWIVEGMSGREVAEQLGISHRTVEIMRQHAKAKLNARTTAHAAVIFYKKYVCGEPKCLMAPSTTEKNDPDLSWSSDQIG